MIKKVKTLLRIIRMHLFWRIKWGIAPSEEDVEGHYWLIFESRLRPHNYTFLTTIAEHMFARRFTELRKFEDVLKNEKWFKERGIKGKQGVTVDPTVIKQDDEIVKINGGHWAKMPDEPIN
jgi:hypothetical protein